MSQVNSENEREVVEEEVVQQQQVADPEKAPRKLIEVLSEAGDNEKSDFKR